MWAKVVRAVTELEPWLHGTGLRASVLDVFDGVVTLSVVAERPEADVTRGRDMLHKLLASTPGVRDVVFEAAAAAGPVVVEARPMSTAELDIHRRVSDALANHVNPGVAGHGGEIALVDVVDREVFVELRGGCQGCAASATTLRNGVEAAIRAVAPEVTRVIDTTDHAAGASPWLRQD